MYARSRALICVWYPLPSRRNQVTTSESTRKVICCLGTIGSNPWRTTAFANTSGVSSAMSDRSMSPSVSASIRSQSVFEVERLFTACGFAHRYHADCIGGFGVSDEDDPFFQEAEGQEALFVAEMLGVRKSFSSTSEHFLCVREVKEMLPVIQRSFPIVPLKSHCSHKCSLPVSEFTVPCQSVFRTLQAQ